MKTNSPTPSFQGVKPFGFVKFGESDYLKKIEMQISNAQNYAKQLKKEGKDVFVVKLSTKDCHGNSHGGAKTYVLFDEDAKIPNLYETIKKNLIKFFKNDLTSDLFTNELDKKLDEISIQQNKIAAFIAENKAPIE